MDLFAQLDRVEPELTGEQTVMVRYRIRFHREVIYSHLSTNPSMPQEKIAAAVAINDPHFLPQPWPPLSLNDATSTLLASLIKMKAITNVGLKLPSVTSALLTGVISNQFPERALIPTTSEAITSCETRITEGGSVTSSISFPNISLFEPDPSTDSSAHRKYKRYTEAMTILGMQLYLESLR